MVNGEGKAAYRHLLRFPSDLRILLDHGDLSWTRYKVEIESPTDHSILDYAVSHDDVHPVGVKSEYTVCPSGPLLKIEGVDSVQVLVGRNPVVGREHDSQRTRRVSPNSRSRAYFTESVNVRTLGYGRRELEIGILEDQRVCGKLCTVDESSILFYPVRIRRDVLTSRVEDNLAGGSSRNPEGKRFRFVVEFEIG